MMDDKKKPEEITESEVQEIEKAEQAGEKLLDEGTIQGFVDEMLKEADAELDESADEAYKAALEEIEKNQ